MMITTTDIQPPAMIAETRTFIPDAASFTACTVFTKAILTVFTVAFLCIIACCLFLTNILFLADCMLFTCMLREGLTAFTVFFAAALPVYFSCLTAPALDLPVSLCSVSRVSFFPISCSLSPALSKAILPVPAILPCAYPEGESSFA